MSLTVTRLLFRVNVHVTKCRRTESPSRKRQDLSLRAVSGALAESPEYEIDECRELRCRSAIPRTDQAHRSWRWQEFRQHLDETARGHIVGQHDLRLQDEANTAQRRGAKRERIVGAQAAHGRLYRRSPKLIHTVLIHTVLASAANVADSQALPHLLHGKETCVWGIRPTRVRPMRSARWLPAPATARTAAIALVSGWMKPSRPRTATSPGCAPRSSTASG